MIKQGPTFFATLLSLLAASGCCHQQHGSQAEAQAASSVERQHKPAIPTPVASGKLDRMLSDAKTEYERAHLEAAERSLQRILELDPQNHRALYYLRLVQSQWLRTPKGRQEDNRPPAQLIDRMFSAAKTEFEQGRLEAAERSLQRVIELDPENQRALYYLGLVHRELHRQLAPPPNPLPVNLTDPTPPAGPQGAGSNPQRPRTADTLLNVTPLDHTTP